MYMQKYSFRTKFLFIILLTKFSNKIEFPIHLYMVICKVCNLSNSLKYPKSFKFMEFNSNKNVYF